VLASLLPGVRHLRAPLAAGYLWLVIAWIFLHRRWDSSPERGEATEAILALRDQVSAAGFVIALSFAAYVIGSISHPLTSTLAARLVPAGSHHPVEGPIGFSVSTGLSSRGYEHLISVIKREQRIAQDILVNKGFDDTAALAQWALDNDARLMDHPGGVLEAAQNPEHKETIDGMGDMYASLTAMELVRNDLPLVHLRLAGSEATRELFAEIDRTRAEAEMRLAIWLPIALLIVVIAGREWGKLGLLVSAAPAIGIAIGLAHQGLTRLQAANDSLVDVVRSRVGHLPTFELLREQATAAHR